MGSLKRFKDYWSETAKIAKEGHEMKLFMLNIALVVWAFAAKPLGVENPDAILWGQRIAVIYSVGFVLVWLPFKRHEELDEKHQTAIRGLRDEIEETKNELVPNLEISCDPADPLCHVPLLNHDDRRMFFRAVAKNVSASQIDGCSAQLEWIKKDDVLVMGHEIRRLGFYPGHEPDAVSKTILAHGRMPFDVLVAVADGQVHIGTPAQLTRALTLRGERVFAEPGVYILSVKVGGRGTTSTDAQLKFNWTGDLETSTLSKIEAVENLVA